MALAAFITGHIMQFDLRINPEKYTFLNKYDSFWAYVAARAVSQFPNNLINMFLAYGVFCVFDTIKFTSAYLR